jgi:hypothetical protein
MKKIVYLFFFVVSSSFAQEILPIKGRIVSSVTRFRPMGQIEIRFKGTYDIHTADKEGNFLLYPKKEREKYTLIINAGTHQELEYTYLSEWRKRSRPKSIVVYSNFDVSKKTARQDFKKGNLKLFIQGGIAPIANRKEDDKFEKKYKISYVDFGCDLKTIEALLDYNKRAFFFLDMTYGKKWRKRVRKDVKGL